MAARSSLVLDDSHVGSEHLLMGLIAEGAGLAADVLAEFGVGAERVQAEIIRQREV